MGNWDIGFILTEFDDEEKMNEIEAEINAALGDEEMDDDEKNHMKACVFSYVISNGCSIKYAIKEVSKWVSY